MTARMTETVTKTERVTGVAEEKNLEEMNQEAAESGEACGNEAAQECQDSAQECECGNTEAQESAEGAEETAAEQDGADSTDKEKKGFFSKKKDKKEETFKAQITELQDKVMRQMAEFENFRRRTEKEKTAMFETGAKSVIEKILPVVDNFERGLAMVPEESKDEPFVDGMNKIYRQLMTELENMGVKPIEAVGQEFNPDLHNAVMQVENDELESGTVAQELQKGYTYRDSVVRHSMVAVVQ